MTGTAQLLRISPTLSLPIEAVTRKFFFTGISGGGKSYAAGKFVEELARVEAQYAVIDGVGHWYGLRVEAVGKGKGLSVYVFGGLHGDVPLEPTGGALMADVLVDTGISAVIDVSEFTGGEMRRFVTDFATRLLKRKKGARSPVMLVWEEAQDVVPQRVTGETARMVGAVERLAKQGRNYGIGTTLISQRPQAVNKDVVNQVEVIFAFQTNGSQERAALKEWMRANNVDLALLDNLPSLTAGSCYVWSPSWLREFKQIRFGKKWTYDSSATPTFGADVDPIELVPLDLAAISKAMADTIERAKDSDPTALRKQVAASKAEIARLERELVAVRASRPAAKVEKIEVLVLGEREIRRLEAAFSGFGERFAGVAADMSSLAAKVGETTGTVLAAVRTVRAPAAPQLRSTRAVLGPTRNGAESAPNGTAGPASKRVPTTESAVAPGLQRAQQRMLDALASLATLGIHQVSKHNVAVFTSQSPKSSQYKRHLAALHLLGHISYPTSATAQLTTAGAKLAHVTMDIRSLDDLRRAWVHQLPAAQGKMLLALAEAYPDSLTREDLADKTNQSIASSQYKRHMAALCTLGIAQYPDHGSIVATEILFPAGLA